MRRICKTNATFVAVLLTLALNGCVAPTPASAPASPKTSNVSLVGALKSPVLVAHRGGAAQYPESSMEAFKAVAEDGFPIEMDIRSLADGTLVPLHDAEVDRTMIGVSGRVTNLSIDEWLSARIVHPKGGKAGTPTTWAGVLDRFGGEHLLVPEIKISGTALDIFIDSIKSRGLEDAMIVQSFDLESCRRMAKAGLNVLYLVGSKTPDPNTIAEYGIDYVGPAKTISQRYLQALQAAGLTTWPYTVNSVVTAERLLNQGADGVFTDDPWKLSALS